MKLFLFSLLLTLASINLFAYRGSSNWKGPDFLIIGERKCGTTSLFFYLCKHPNILMPREKELFFFSSDEKFYQKNSVQWYQNQFARKRNNRQRLFEASTLYLYHPAVPERVKKLFPNTRLIILLRNPVDRIYSGYKHNRDRIGETRSFHEVLEDEFNSFEQKFNNPSPNIGTEDDPLYRGIYEHSIRRWTQHFSKEQILIIFSSELFSNPKKTLKRIYKHIGVRDFILPEYSRYNAGDDQDILDNATRELLEQFYEPYQQQLKEYLWNEFELIP